MATGAPVMTADTASSAIQLRPYQLDALTAIEHAVTRGCRRPLAVLPTGAGKTVVFSAFLRARAQRNDAARHVVFEHRDELVRQAEDKIRLVAPDVPIGLVKAARNELQHPITIASVQTVSRPSRLAQLVERGPYDTIVVDEAHHAPAASCRRILEALGAFTTDGPLVLGVTATADRADGRGLAEIFEEIVFEIPMLDLIADGYLANFHARQIQLRADFEQLHTRAGEFIEREAEALLLAADAPIHTVRAYQQHAPGRRALVFTSGVRLAHEMTAAFTGAGIAAAAVDGTMPLESRRRVIAAFACGDLQVVSNCAVLTEGFDEPSIDAIIIARPTKSRPLYQQMIGRGARPSPGRTTA